MKNDTPLVDIKQVGEEDLRLAHEPNPDNERACLERQLAGQENVLFPDLIHPSMVLKLRLQTAEFLKQNGEKGMPVTQILGHEIYLPHPGTLDPKLIELDFQKEYSTRYTTGGSVLPKAPEPKPLPKFENSFIPPMPPVFE